MYLGQTQSSDTDKPETKDYSNTWLWFALMVIAGSGLIGMTVYKRKKQAE